MLKGTVNTHEVFGEDSCIDGNSEPEFEVVDMHQDCNVVFFTRPLQRSTLVAYDMDSKKVHALRSLTYSHLLCTPCPILLGVVSAC